jgi:hypothetical protein
MGCEPHSDYYDYWCRTMHHHAASCLGFAAAHPVIKPYDVCCKRFVGKYNITCREMSFHSFTCAETVDYRVLLDAVSG